MQGFGCLFLTAWGVGCVCGSAAAMTILASVDIFLLIFAIPPVIGSLYFGMKESEEEFAARREETFGKRKMEYAKGYFTRKNTQVNFAFILLQIYCLEYIKRDIRKDTRKIKFISAG